MDPASDNSSVVLYRAPWVIPVTSPIIQDGVVAVKGSRIIAVGLWSELSLVYPDNQTHHCSGLLMPGLINAHIHLELSIYGVVPQENAESTMCDWVRSLLHKRMTADYAEKEINTAAEQCAKEQYASGVVVLLDTGNNPLPQFTAKIPEIYSLLELLGPTEKATDVMSGILNNLSTEKQPTGHAPYSTAPRLLQNIKEHTLKKGTLFSLHVAENPDESLLLFQGKGCFFDFLQERDALDGTFPLPKDRYLSVIDYLEKTHILDDKTICVHCVYVNDADIKIIAKKRSHVCLCPSSNKFIGVDVAPLKAFLAGNILPALGTDSTASNPQMNMWHEMELLRREFADVPSATILAMATIAGAKALGRETDYGSIEAGKSSHFLGVEDEKISTATCEKELLDILTSIEKPEKVTHFNDHLAG